VPAEILTAYMMLVCCRDWRN